MKENGGKVKKGKVQTKAMMEIKARKLSKTSGDGANARAPEMSIAFKASNASASKKEIMLSILGTLKKIVELQTLRAREREQFKMRMDACVTVIDTDIQADRFRDVSVRATVLSGLRVVLVDLISLLHESVESVRRNMSTGRSSADERVSELWCRIRDVGYTFGNLAQNDVVWNDLVSNAKGTVDAHVRHARVLTEATSQYSTVRQADGDASGWGRLQFLLQHSAKYLHKGLNPKQHPSVNGFVTDEWQYDLLEHVRMRHSVLVVGPTTAGKSFVAMYAIRQVILEDEKQIQNERIAEEAHLAATKGKAGGRKGNKYKPEGDHTGTKVDLSILPKTKVRCRVVFVCPTLALCNQTAGEVRRQFPLVPVGVFTAKFRESIHTCEVLVCTPHMLEILYQSPANHIWRTRILRWVICDEIHMMSSFDGPQRNPSAKMLASADAISVSDEYSAEDAGSTIEACGESSRSSDDQKTEDEDEDETNLDGCLRRLLGHIECPVLALSASIVDPSLLASFIEAMRSTGDRQYQGYADQRCTECIISTEGSVDKADRTTNQELEGAVGVDIGRDSEVGSACKCDENRNKVWVVPSPDAEPRRLLERYVPLQYLVWLPERQKLQQIHPYGMLAPLCQDEEELDDALVDLHKVQLSGPEVWSVARVLLDQNPDHFLNYTPLWSELAESLKTTDPSIDGKAGLKDVIAMVYSSMSRIDMGDLTALRHATAQYIQTRLDMTQQTHLFETLLAEGKEQSAEDLSAEISRSTRNPISYRIEDDPTDDSTTAQHGVTEMLRILSELKTQKLLPALMFSDSTPSIECLFGQLVDSLETREALSGFTYECTAAEGAERKWKGDQMDETDRRAELSGFQRLKMSRRLWVQHARMVLWPVDPVYSFRGQTARSNEMNDVTDLNWWVTRLYRKVRKSQADLYMRGIARGIAMHHSGLNKAYRDMVEAFTRSGIITVVIATKSLAVGVNFPIRTSVFLDSGRYMDSTSFRQMCGRAGRRGFDDCGYVVTIGLHLAHLATLVIAPAHKLNIPHGLDVNSLLRILIMRQGKALGTKSFALAGRDSATLVTITGISLTHHHPGMSDQSLQKYIDTATENASYVQNVVKRWMLVPQQSTVYSSTTGAMWGYHFFHQLLYRLKLVDGYSNPIGLAGLVSHCGEHYPANLAFAYMLLTGSLSSVLVVDNKPEAISSPTSNNERLRALSLVYVSVMSHAMKWHDYGETDRTVAAYTLPQVPQSVQEGLAQYNRLVRSTFRDCERVFGTSGADMYGPYLPVMPITQKSRNGYLYLFMNGTQYGTVVDHCQMTDKSLYAQLTRELLFMRKVTTSLSLCLDDTDPIVADMKVLTHAFQANYDAIEY